jgi:hypothetical protein
MPFLESHHNQSMNLTALTNLTAPVEPEIFMSEPHLFLMTRTFAGDRMRFHTVLQPSLEMFVDWRFTHFTLVLDDESREDHAWGDELLANLSSAWNFSVRYAPPLSDKAKTYTTYKNPGYARQIYDTFFFDTWLPAWARASDLLGVLDVDSPLLTVTSPKAMLLLGNGAGTPMIGMPYTVPPHFSDDRLLLGERVEFDTMYTDTMPK